ncbi:MAG: TolC family protein, partial [Acidobacteria bacterium]
MKLWMLAFGVVITTVVQAQDSSIHRFSVQQAIAYAEKNNAQVKNALLDVKIQEQTNRDFTSAAYPQINGNASFVYNTQVPVSLVPGDFFGQPGTFVPLKFGVKYSAT